jgi:hypothetical protein
MARPWTSLGSLVLLVFPLACKIDDTPGGDEVGDTSTGESETTTDTDTGTETETSTDTDEGNFIPGETTDTTETGEPPEPMSCREMLDCVFMCLGDLGLECLQTCGEGFDQAEVQKAGALVLCLGQACVDKDQCSLADLTNPDCVGCIGLGLFLPEPPGCEAEAMACE